MAIDMVSIIDGIITPSRIIAERRLIIELLSIAIIYHSPTFSQPNEILRINFKSILIIYPKKVY